jgi:hypothetical protein
LISSISLCRMGPWWCAYNSIAEEQLSWLLNLTFVCSSFLGPLYILGLLQTKLVAFTLTDMT